MRNCRRFSATILRAIKAFAAAPRGSFYDVCVNRSSWRCNNLRHRGLFGDLNSIPARRRIWFLASRIVFHLFRCEEIRREVSDFVEPQAAVLAFTIKHHLPF